MRTIPWLTCSLVLLAHSWISMAPAAGEEAGDDLVQLVVNLLADKDKDVRSLGLEQIRTEAKGTNATKQFAAQLPKLPPDAQIGLLSALADRGDQAARPGVLDLLTQSRDEAVKVAAISALGNLGQQEDLKVLVPLLAGGSQPEKAAARKSLERLRGEKISTAIAAEIKPAAAPVRVALMQVLVVRRARNTLDAIVPAATDADPKVRAAAMTALGELAGPQQIPVMVQGVLTSAKGSEHDAAERAVALVCRRSAGTADPASPLLAAIDKLSTAERIELLSTLGRVGGVAALKQIEAAIASTDPATHAAGLRALCNWPDASVAARLIELANSDAHPEHQTMALGALIRVAPLPDKRPAIERLELLKKVMAMTTKDSQRNAIIKRASAIRTVDSLRFIVFYLDQPAFAQQACESVVELAHHRDLREPNKAEFHKVLDRVMQTSQDATVKDRAQRYKNNQTWVRPTVQK